MAADFHGPPSSTKVTLTCADGKHPTVPTCSFLHLHEHKGTNLAWRIEFPMSLYPGITVGGTDNFKWNVLAKNRRIPQSISASAHSTSPLQSLRAGEHVRVLDTETGNSSRRSRERQHSSPAFNQLYSLTISHTSDCKHPHEGGKSPLVDTDCSAQHQ